MDLKIEKGMAFITVNDSVESNSLILIVSGASLISNSKSF